MIGPFRLTHCGPLDELRWSPAPGFNVIIGENNTGKTMLLKLLYSVIRSIEEFGAGDDLRPYEQVLEEKLLWTYQVKRLGALVARGRRAACLQFEGSVDDQPVLLTIARQANRRLTGYSRPSRPRAATSVFIPAREVISLAKVIRRSRVVDRQFGFDDTYLDLILALDKDPVQGGHTGEYAAAQRALSAVTRGDVYPESDEWTYRTNGDRYPISLAAEGIRKLGMVHRLISSQTIAKGSVVFIDEPEASLHPEAAIAVVEALGSLVTRGLQVFVATHSFVVMKKLELIARAAHTPIPVVSLSTGRAPYCTDLVAGMPENPIVDASLRLYREEIGLSDHA